ncbi:MAG: divalent-cation tolerance protein CutA [Alphaproteobacteria bacterium]|nr:divalent-cation tolerance protein CutA [Alphaproteobacteria bacterium]
MIYVTARDADEARRIAGALLEKKLIACANLLAPHTAMYRWKGDIVAEEEQAMILKTRVDLLEPVRAEICALHSYETPCIVAWPLAGGHGPFLQWIEAETETPA